jgi:hypothetical protein
LWASRRDEPGFRRRFDALSAGGFSTSVLPPHRIIALRGADIPQGIIDLHSPPIPRVATLQLLLPIGSEGATLERSKRLAEVICALASSLARIDGADDAVSIAILLNGSLQTRRPFLESLNAMQRTLTALPGVHDVRRIYDTRSDKVHSLNRVFRRAGDFDGVAVMDDDILVPPSAIPEIFEFLKHRNRHDEAYCFPKCAVATASSGELSAHQREMSFLFHPSTMRLLQQTSFFSPRPSGSLYALPQEHIKPFPEPCNEAEVLRYRRYLLSDQYARTWYPSTIRAEINRRARQHQVSMAFAQRSRPKNNDFLVSWEAIVAELPRGLTPSVLARLKRVLAFQMHIVASSIARTSVESTGRYTSSSA